MRPSKAFAALTLLTLLSIFSGALSPAHSSESRSKRVTELATPNGVVAVPGSSSTVLRFSAVPNATSYKVRLYTIRGENPLRTIAPFNSGESVSALTPNSTYKITVQAMGNGVRYSNSEESRKVSVTTLSALAVPAFSLTPTVMTATAGQLFTSPTPVSTGGAIASFSIDAGIFPFNGLSFNTSTGVISGTPTTAWITNTYTITATNAAGSATATFTLAVITATCANGGTCIVGDRGPGGGIVYYVSAANFTSTGSTCNTTCKYLEVAPATWQSAGVTVADDLLYKWSDNTSVTTGQDSTTASTEGIAAMSAYEKLNWKIGQGFYNTSVMIVSGATSEAQATVLAYAGTSIAGQWFIPSMNELNELCKYARGQSTGDPTVASVIGSGIFKSTLNAGTDLGGFVESYYWSSTEDGVGAAGYQYFVNGNQASVAKSYPLYVRPVRAF